MKTTLALSMFILVWYWSGVWIRDGSELAVSLRFERTESGWEGSFDSNQLRVTGVPLRDISTSFPTLSWKVVGDRTTMVFRGRIEGDVLSGEFEENGARGTFRLERFVPNTRPPAEKEITFSNGDGTLSGTLLLPPGYPDFLIEWVKQITPGTVTTLIQLRSPWAPTGVALFGSELLVLESPHTASENRSEWLPRVWKISPDGKTENMKTKRLTPELLRQRDAYWRAANYLSAGQNHLYDNPLLRKPLKLTHIKPRLFGHWGTTAGLNFVRGFTRIAGRLSGLTASGRNRPL